MSNTYRLPESLTGDIDKFASLAKGYTDKSVSPTEFKAFRVPLGVYEQRKDNVYMARVRATGGVITPSQLLQLIGIAQQHHSNLLHLTTRQEVQIQNLALDDVEPILRKLQDIGLATKGGGGNTVRNIIVSEMSGIAPETFDTTPYAIELTSLMVAEPDSYLLPRKMKIAFSSDEHNIDYAAINDVGLVAQLRDGHKGFRVFVGGGAGARPSVGWELFDFMPAENLYTLVKALKNFFSAHGNRKDRNKARIRFIFYKLGQEETLRLIRQYYDQELALNHPFSVAEPTDVRPAYDYTPVGAEPTDEAYALWKQRFVGRQRQAGYVTIVLPVILGNIRLDDDKLDTLKRTLQFASRFGEDTVRFTNTQNIRLRNIPEGALAELYGIVSTLTEETATPLVVNNIISCTGADTCRLGIGLSKGLAGAIRRELLRSGIDLDRLSEVSIHVTGCPNSCGQQLWADLGFAGRALRNERAYPGYQVFVGASRRRDPKLAEAIGNISARDVPQFVVRLFADYLGKASGVSFAEYLLSGGKEKAEELLAEYKEIPSFADDKNYYFDWGAQEIFTVTPQGKAECSAGLFDMINVDIDTIRTNREKLAAGLSEADADRAVHDIVFAASRMLLVTRGLDPKTTGEALTLFVEHFIAPGYVDGRYEAIVDEVRRGRREGLRLRQGEAFELADAVIALYEGMDDSLQFRKPGAATTLHDIAPEAAPAEALDHRTKDLRGVLCPMNFVRTKLELATLSSGELLEVWLDDGEPINNVPGSVRLEGHAVLETTQVDDYWRVVIRKK